MRQIAAEPLIWSGKGSSAAVEPKPGVSIGGKRGSSGLTCFNVPSDLRDLYERVSLLFGPSRLVTLLFC